MRWRLRRLWLRFLSWFTGRIYCTGCGKEIDPECCWCGTESANHGSEWNGHGLVPMGCDCLRVRP